MKRVLLVCLLLCMIASVSAQERRHVLVRVSQPYDGVVAAIEQAGGTVTHRFKHVNGIAAEVPESALAQIERLVGRRQRRPRRDDPAAGTVDPRGGPVDGEAEADDSVTLDAPGASLEPGQLRFQRDAHQRGAAACGRPDRRRCRHRGDRQRLPSDQAARRAVAHHLARA